MAERSRDVKVASLLLRVGLAAVFLYAGIASLRSPLEWEGYLPAFLTHLFAPLLVIRLIAIYELVLAAWLLIGRYTRFAAAAAAATLAGILLANFSQLMITFRDVGLLCAALALIFVDKNAS
jgi:uncharacterized membrane protein YphA (DoxX/SURF4 family)